MTLRVMGVFVASGTPEELSEYTVRVSWLLKAMQDKQDEKDLGNAVDALWREIGKKNRTDGRSEGDSWKDTGRDAHSEGKTGKDTGTDEHSEGR